MSEEQLTILAVDDDASILTILKDLLQAEGYRVLTAACAAVALELLAEAPKLIILDLMMPEIDGIELCREIRRQSLVPVLFLTAKSQPVSKEQALAVGGDDYLCKPFSRVELVSRIKALLRRCYVYGSVAENSSSDSGHIIRGRLEFNKADRVTLLSGKKIKLTQIETKLLELMLESPGRIFSSRELYELVWNRSFSYVDNNIVVVHICRLRDKLGDSADEPAIIKNIWGKGYYID